MPLSKTIRDVMVPLAEYPSLRDTATLKDAFAVLRGAFTTGKRFRHILVLNDKGQLIGILGMRDILHGLFPEYLRAREHSRLEGGVPDFPALTHIWAETFRTQCPAAAEQPIKGFLGRIPGKLGINDPVTMAAYLLVIHDTSMLPVVDGERLVGVVRMIDVFNEASKVVLHD